MTTAQRILGVLGGLIGGAIGGALCVGIAAVAALMASVAPPAAALGAVAAVGGIGSMSYGVYRGYQRGFWEGLKGGIIAGPMLVVACFSGQGNPGQAIDRTLGPVRRNRQRLDEPLLPADENDSELSNAHTVVARRMPATTTRRTNRFEHDAEAPAPERKATVRRTNHDAGAPAPERKATVRQAQRSGQPQATTQRRPAPDVTQTSQTRARRTNKFG